MDKAYELITNKLSAWGHKMISLLPNIVLAALILVLGAFVATRLKKLSGKVLLRFIRNETIANLFNSLIYISLLGLVLFAALSVLELDQAVVSLLAGAGILGLALAFAFQDIAANFMSGIFISLRKPLHVGDIVKIKDYMGEVVEINLRDTVIKTFQGQMVIVPNKEVFQSPIENYSLLGKRRMDITIGVSYGDDLEKVRSLTLKTVAGIDMLAQDEEITMFYQEFADFSINFILRLWVSTPGQIAYLQVRNDCIMRLKKAYDENGITIPYPIRTLDFGIKGGASLSEMPVTVTGKG